MKSIWSLAIFLIIIKYKQLNPSDLESLKPLFLFDEVDLKLWNFCEIVSIVFVDEPDTEKEISVIGHRLGIAQTVTYCHSLFEKNIGCFDLFLLRYCL